MIEIVNTFFYYSLFFFKNIIETFSAVLAFSGEEIVIIHPPVSPDLLLAVKILQRSYFLSECV